MEKVEIHILKEGTAGEYGLCGARLNFHDWVKGDSSEPDYATCFPCLGWQPIDSAPKDGRDVMLLIRHKNYEYAPSPKWEEAVIGHWIDHNGGGWTYHGLYGSAVAWKTTNGE